MKITITGSLGNIGKPLTQELVQKGHSVTVVSNNAEKQKDIETLGAKAAIGSIHDLDFLTKAFTGADAVYVMTPPSYSEPDLMVYFEKIGSTYAQAIKQAGVKRVVHLSSIGADLDKGTGIILGPNKVEGILNEMPGVAVTHIRPALFYSNFYGLIGLIKGAGIVGSNYGGNVLLSSPIDIAAAVAEELTSSNSAKVRYVISDERSANELASVLGNAIGKPDLKWVIFTDERSVNGMIQNGIPPHFAKAMTEMGSSMNTGALRSHYDKNKPSAFGKVKLEEFAKEFAYAFNHS